VNYCANYLRVNNLQRIALKIAAKPVDFLLLKSPARNLVRGVRKQQKRNLLVLSLLLDFQHFISSIYLPPKTPQRSQVKLGN
jgi:hypothetical protein